ncbi:hypothetical protein HHK36_020462 [Tetracentron sinense]|uniref:PPM-type phosphatase domain-containing protein n=1 Tax=Tetracentron sinense TaxID=13715 RepID=A0A834YV62_TETSI|nr:hypothetical protein HHK36_020462 [Tetracentron sinense]
MLGFPSLRTDDPRVTIGPCISVAIGSYKIPDEAFKPVNGKSPVWESSVEDDFVSFRCFHINQRVQHMRVEVVKPLISSSGLWRKHVYALFCFRILLITNGKITRKQLDSQFGILSSVTAIFDFEAIRVRRFLTGDVESSKRDAAKKPSWMTPISHGFHVVEDWSLRGESDGSVFDSVVAQREQIEDAEVWLFGVFDAQLGDGVTKYMQSHLFDKNLTESQIRRKSKETLRKAYLCTRAKIGKGEEENETGKWGSTSVIVINGEKLVAASMGDYRAVVCRDGVAHQIGKRRQRRAKRHWSLNLISGVWRMPRVSLLACESGNAAGSKQSKSSEPVLGVERIDSDSEFVILASSGIWEVMKNQEAVNLVRHIDNPQEAAECLAKEALTRMSKINISCVVIRFD